MHLGHHHPCTCTHAHMHMHMHTCTDRHSVLCQKPNQYTYPCTVTLVTPRLLELTGECASNTCACGEEDPTSSTPPHASPSHLPPSHLTQPRLTSPPPEVLRRPLHPLLAAQHSVCLSIPLHVVLTCLNCDLWRGGSVEGGGEREGEWREEGRGRKGRREGGGKEGDNMHV